MRSKSFITAAGKSTSGVWNPLIYKLITFYYNIKNAINDILFKKRKVFRDYDKIRQEENFQMHEIEIKNPKNCDFLTV